MNCQFCLTAKLGFSGTFLRVRSRQVVAVLKRQAVKVGRDRINLVFMGMGEPFLNYDEFMAAVRLLVDGAGLAESRMTVSTRESCPEFCAWPGSRCGPGWRSASMRPMT